MRYCFMVSAVLVSAKSTQRREVVENLQPVLSGTLLLPGFENATCTYSTKPACDGNAAISERHAKTRHVLFAFMCEVP